MTLHLMMRHFDVRRLAPALGAAALLGLALPALPARAGDGEPPVTLTLTHVSVPAALQLLFQRAGITRYTVAPEVQGWTSIAVQDVPLRTALNAVLGAASPPAVFTVENGVYQVAARRAAPAPPAAAPAVTVKRAVIGAKTLGQVAAGSAKARAVIGINHSDAYVIAQLFGAQGIVNVPADASQYAGSRRPQGGSAARRGGAGAGGPGRGGRGRRNNGGYGVGYGG